MLRILVTSSLLIFCQFLLAQSCPTDINLGQDTAICPGGSVELQATTIPAEVLNTIWSPLTNLTVAADGLSAMASPATTTVYNLEVRYLSGPELVFNGDFSQGDTGFTTDYDFGNSIGGNGPLDDEGQYRITNNPPAVHEDFGNCGDHTSGTGNMMVVNGSNSAVNVWCQTITVENNVDYAFSAFVTTMVALNPAILQFSINGSLFGDPFPAPSQICPWNQFFAIWSSGAATSAEICIRNLNTNGDGNDFAIDDISFRRTCLTDDSQEVAIAPAALAELNGASSFCSEQGSIPLSTLLSGSSTPGGQWTLDGLNILPTNLEVGLLLAGNHVLRYEVGQAGCTSADDLNFTVVQPASSGIAIRSGSHCAGSTTAFELFDLLSDFDPGGVWALPQVLNGTPFSPTSGMLDLGSAPVGTYDFSYTVDPGAPCGPTSTTVQIEVVAAPLPASPPIDTVLDCFQPELSLDANEAGLTNVSFAWSRDGQNIANQAIITATEAGVYQYQVTDNSSGCSSTLDINITDERSTPNFSLNTDSLRCDADNNVNQGQIEVENISGGMAPYLYQLNDGTFQADSVFTDLSPGNFVITIEDAGGCQATESVLLPDPLDFELQLINNTPDITGFGEAVNISLQSTISTSDLANLIWEPLGIGDTAARSITVILNEPIIVVATVTTSLGCTFRAELPIAPEAGQILFAPNAFSPNGDGQNDSWLPFGSQAVASITSVQIFDRWGAPVFQTTDQRAGDLDAGWNGIVRGKLAQIGVYAYFVEVELRDGSRQTFAGELNLLR